ncbi:acyloxyacyl hydrolase [Salinimonas marina]|uniref:Lipid A deacylase n=1 Tax=Salinimonas marina TaxID=2785918 RepID=A0A7S9DXL5_9ALTE|nr:acyloxyacyl hydrolase [Salinimonas marina]QPG05702.1 acyloxyacyl hydrolase [Salinimonas marina]
MLRVLTMLVFLCCYGGASPVFAATQTVAVDYLQGSDDIKGVRLAYRPASHEITTDWFGKINLYWEASMNFWEYGDDNTHSSNFALSVSPVLTKRIGTIAESYPVYFEFGIGASLVNDREFAGKDMGSHYQFEDRIGFIFSLNEKQTSQVSVRYMHYSNAGLNDKNPGLDFLSVAYAHHF